MTLKYIWRSFQPSHFHVYFSNAWLAFASRGLPAIAELLVDLLPWQRNLGYFCKNFKCFFFFVSRWYQAIFRPSVHHDPLYNTLFLDFWFRPPNPPKFTPKQMSYIKAKVHQIWFRLGDSTPDPAGEPTASGVGGSEGSRGVRTSSSSAAA